MIRRLWCRIWSGHRWVLLARNYVPPAGQYVFGSIGNYQRDQMNIFGFTELYCECSKCGKPIKAIRLGNWIRSEVASDELAELRKMAGL